VGGGEGEGDRLTPTRGLYRPGMLQRLFESGINRTIRRTFVPREIWECLELMMGGRDITTERDEAEAHAGRVQMRWVHNGGVQR